MRLACVGLVTLLGLLAGCQRPDDRDRLARAMQEDSVPVLVGAGDIGDCDSEGAGQTAALLDSIRGTIFVAGDAGYASGKNPDPMVTCYDPTWGRHRARTRPTPGNHEYNRGGPARYFEYFGKAAGDPSKGYYSYDLGTWHVLALNTTLPTAPGSGQDAWIRRDLEASLGKCTVAYMHHPAFSSGPHDEQQDVRPLWSTLASYGVSVAIAGHDHIYERFERLDAAGEPDAKGVRQFVVGTGGARRYRIEALRAGSEAHSSENFGLLKLSLLKDRYRWEFIPVDATGFEDRGEESCSGTHAAR